MASRLSREAITSLAGTDNSGDISDDFNTSSFAVVVVSPLAMPLFCRDRARRRYNYCSFAYAAKPVTRHVQDHKFYHAPPSPLRLNARRSCRFFSFTPTLVLKHA
jgi:hypothetical protein